MANLEAQFKSLVERIRSGDERAADELVQAFEPEVRRFVRFRLTSPELRRIVDSLDISQSVFSKFFVEFREGRIDVQSPEQLRGLLMTMARNRLFDLARRELAEKRDARRLVNTQNRIVNVADPTSSVSSQFAMQELMQAVLERLTSEERQLLEQRLSGRAWEDLSQEFHVSGDALRKRMARAIDRVASELRLIS